ncbi:hypothetical protein EN742_01680 [Mesorhizobium sp. M4A.F.Ca.ET.020.02.1.1]|uniref:hypothetical protein n=1 Tax=Mesorhizobium sp. M4A.F.Ca.ET.020.02.1.1 TaxID=2496652 RepID=UPI000FD39E7B|nr:hypothetical protein [Mesorhizobium sp. M4A.F.Ca.ET.020.02.1.1]RVD44652.1 hypothetical protein EN742_01680 [Mesorhizobium sp. M4A.F.Ca.ET.020.02.1.1]
MAFNSDTYHANKYRRIAFEEIAQAKDIKRRAAIGQAYDWEVRRIPSLVSNARTSLRLSRLYRECAKLKL